MLRFICCSAERCYVVCLYAECCILFVVLLSVLMVSVVMLSVVMLSVVAPDKDVKADSVSVVKNSNIKSNVSHKHKLN